MRRNRFERKYVWLFCLAAIFGTASTWLWMLSGTCPVEIIDTKGGMAKLADKLGGEEFLSGFYWTFISVSSVSWLVVMLMLLTLAYKSIRVTQASKALNGIFKLIPKAPDHLIAPQLAKQGIVIENGKISISGNCWRLASPGPLAYSLAHLLYLYSRDHLTDLLTAERTVFHELAELLLNNADSQSIADFMETMRDEKIVIGELLDIAFQQNEYRSRKESIKSKFADDIERIDKLIAKSEEQQESVISLAESLLKEKAERVTRSSVVQLSDFDAKNVVVSESLREFGKKVGTIMRLGEEASKPEEASKLDIEPEEVAHEPAEPASADDITLGYLKPEVLRVLLPEDATLEPKNAGA